MSTETTTQVKALVLMAQAWIAILLNYVGLGAEVFLIYAVLLVIDYITGLGRSYRLKIEITSMAMKLGMFAKLSCLFIPIVLGLGFKVMGSEGKSALEVGMTILCLSEAYSSISNIYAMQTGKNLPEIDAIASLARWLKAKILSFEEATAVKKQDPNDYTPEKKVEQDV